LPSLHDDDDNEIDDDDDDTRNMNYKHVAYDLVDVYSVHAQQLDSFQY